MSDPVQSNFTRLDRDLLIRLDTKVDGLQDQIKDIAMGTTMRLAKVEARLDQEDIYHAKIDLNYYNDLAKWASGMRANLKVVGAIFMFFNAVITTCVVLIIKRILGI